MRINQLTVTQRANSLEVARLLRELERGYGIRAENLRDVLDVMQQTHGINKSLLCTKGICNSIRDFYSHQLPVSGAVASTN